MKILILGAGGTGGYFGGRLAQSGADTTFLVRPERAKRLAKTGLVIESERDPVTLPVKTILFENLKHEYDLVILSCKAYDLEESIQSIHAAVGPRTHVLPFLNGVQHFAALDRAFGRSKVLGGCVYIAAALGAEGQIQHLNKMETLIFGAREDSQTAFCEQSLSVFQKSSFETRLSQNIQQDLWEKFVFLCTLAAATCSMRANVGQILATESGEAVLQGLLGECEQTAAQAGYPVRPDVHQEFQSQIANRESTLTASMMRDLVQGRRIEADSIVGDMLHRARASRFPAPFLQAALTHLQAYQNQIEEKKT